MQRCLILALPVLLFFSCQGRPSVQSPMAIQPVPGCASPQKILTIQKEDVYDLSGYEYVTGVSAYNLFDEPASFDPAAPGNVIPATSPQPPHDPKYYKDDGSSIVVDLRAPHRLSDIFLYDHAKVADSVWVYTGTMTHWTLKAAFATKGNSALWGWRRVQLNDSTRFVKFRFRSWETDISEAVLYGCALSALAPPKPAEYTGPRLAPKMMKEFLGVNCYQGIPIKWMQPFYYTRKYTSINQIDVDTVDRYPDQQYYITPHGWWNNGTNDYVLYADSITRDVGHKVWYSYLGVPKWMELKGFDNHNRPVTKPGMNTSDPMSYARHANMMWTMAACYGTTKVDTHLIRSIVPHRFSGRNIMRLYENGNEPDAAWVGDKYCTPVEYFALSSADYDGHEGAMGALHGIKKADAASELMMAGFTALDVNRLRVLKFLCNTLRTDSQFLWNGGIQYHYYCINGKGDRYSQQFANGTAGLTPEEDSLRKKLTKVRNETYRIQPGVECIMGELGWDKSRESKASAPLVPGFSQSESQGIMLLRAINSIAFAGFDRYIIYWIKDDGDENFPALFQSSGIMKQVGNFEYAPYPAWYYINALVYHLGNYIPEQIVREEGDVWVYKYRNKLSPDSAAYFVYCPSRNGKQVKRYSLATGGVAAQEIVFKDREPNGIAAGLPVRNGNVTIDVGEMPRLVLVKER